MRKLVSNLLRWVPVFALILWTVDSFAQCPTGTISGSVFQDFNFNGLNDDSGSGIWGIKVFVYGDSGVVDSTLTQNNGDFTFTGLTDGTKYRVQFRLQPGQFGVSTSFFGSDAGTTVQFVTAPDCSVSQGFAAPEDYCQATPNIVTPCFIGGDPLAGGTAAGNTAIVGFAENATGQGQTFNINLAQTQQVGSCWGVAYQRETKKLFTSAVLRRHSGFGPGGTGAIYVLDASNPMATTVAGIIDFDALGINTGTDPRILEPLPAAKDMANHDVAAADLIGKMSFGDMEITSDGKYLYIINLYDRKLYKIFINNPYVAPTAANITAITIPDPGCGNSNDWRPWGLKIYRGEVYVGIVCTGESNQSAANLHAYIKKLNAGGTFDAVTDFALNYTRGLAIQNTPSVDKWNPWTKDCDSLETDFKIVWPQPILSDIDFDTDSSMVLGFLDRTAIQGGYLNYLPCTSNTLAYNTFPGGDINRVCRKNGTWVLEGAPAGCQTTNGANNMQGPNGSEYYWSDAFPKASYGNAAAPPTHNEIALGSVLLIPGNGETIATIYDPYTFNTGGATWFVNATGDRNQDYEVFPDAAGFAGKSAGLGALKALCNPAPREIGNLVWKDSNQNGIQDPSESPLSEISVNLYDLAGGACTLLSNTTTNSTGQYYFNDNSPGVTELLPNHPYAVVFGEAGQWNTTNQVLMDSLYLTTANTGAAPDNDLNDSDGLLSSTATCFNGLPHILVTMTDDVHVDHTFDIGFFPQTCDIAWLSVAKTNVVCAGQSNGTITVSAEASDDVEYALDNGSYGPTGTWTGLTAGTYIAHARVIGNPDCALDSSIVILDGFTVAAPTTGSYSICQNSTIPSGAGLTATCSACTSGATPVVSWWTAATGGDSLGVGETFNPITAGVATSANDTIYTFYAQCHCGPCTSSRIPATLTIWPLPVVEITGNTAVCEDASEIYTTASHTGSTYAWSVLSGGVLQSTNGATATIKWVGTPGSGPHSVIVKETDLNGCMKSDTLLVTIRTTVVTCDDDIQVSLNSNCEATVTVGMLLEGSYVSLDGFTFIIKDAAGNIVPNNLLTAKGNYSFKVIEPCIGNSCWGDLIVEDKLGPQIQCENKIFPCSYTDTTTIIPALAGMPTYVQITGGIGGVQVSDSCGITAISYTDNYMDINCDAMGGTISAKIVRTWVASDMSGNTSSCAQQILFERKSVTDIVFPSDVTITCADGDTDPAHTGTPTINGTSIYPNNTYCELNITYTDQKLPICSGSYKLIRTWLAYDWCHPINNNNPNLPPNPAASVQVIKVLDETGPVINCPADLTVSTDELGCYATVNLPDVIVADYCSKISHVEAITPVGTITGSLSSFPGNNLWNPDTLAVLGYISNLPQGTHMITYRISDDCGNVSVCAFFLTVRDDVPPVAICQSLTKASLGSDGTIQVNASSFDAGSHDNCSNVWFKVRRMNSSDCVPNSDLFGDKAKFCCSDLGDTVTVVLRVYDHQPAPGLVGENYLEGHFDDCMIQVIIEDKLKPVVTCPPNVTVTCENFDPSYWSYGQPTAVDNCGLEGITTSVDETQFDTVCNRGTVKRTFVATDHFGNTGKCTQSIVVTYNTDFKVRFPNDVFISQCNASGIYGEPIIENKDCEMTAISYTDQIFTIVQDACFKIVRTWRVIDGCNFNPNQAPTLVDNPPLSDVGPIVIADNINKGNFQYSQIIKVVDNTKPTILNCPAGPVVVDDQTPNDPNLWNTLDLWDPIHQTHDLCEGPAPLSITATDACSGSNITITYTIKLDLNNDGIMETTMQSNEPNAPVLTYAITGNNKSASLDGVYEFPYGNHHIKWFVNDGCGNLETCEYDFLVRDGKKPTVVCINGLSVNIMQTGMVPIWVSDFIQYASDNCTPATQLKFGIRVSGTGTGFPLQTGLTFTCADLGTQFVEIWAQDKAGNSDYCETYILVQDNMGNCDSSSAQIAGALQTEEIEGISDAFVAVTGVSNALPAPGMFSNNSGTYNFNALPIGDDYTITPEKTDFWLNGVSTLDLLKINNHILNIEPLNSPYKIIAADANKSGTVTTFDIVQLRKMILGITTEIPGNTSWRFVDANFQFPNPYNPFETTFPEKLTYADFANNATNGDFVGVKVGDVTNNATANLNAPADDRNTATPLIFNIEDRHMTANQDLVIEFSSNDLARILAYQFTMLFEKEALELVEIIPGELPGMTAENFGTQLISEGIITTSWNAINENNAAKTAFKLHFRTKKAGNVSQWLKLSNSITAIAAYNKSGESADITLQFNSKNGITHQTPGFELFQNEPNPFADKTAIGFFLPEDGSVTLSIYDAAGTVQYVTKGAYQKGKHQITILRSMLPSSGALYYRLDSPSGSAQRKMLTMQ